MTEDDIKNLAPDRQAFAAAKKVADAKQWPKLGKHGDVLWGTVSGSSGEYSVYLDLKDNSLGCSCPSRKRPCKHALGLLLLDAKGHPVPDEEPPSGHKWEAQTRYETSWE